MRVLGLDNASSIKVEDGAKLPKFIRTITIETAEEEKQVRLFLMGALKIDESGCHALSRSFKAEDGSNYRAEANSQNQSLDDKLRIIDSLTTALNYAENIDANNRDLLSEKLKSVVESL